MATAAGFLKNIKVKIKDASSQEQKSEEPMEESKVNNEENSASSLRNPIKEEQKEGRNLELSENENESEENSSSKSHKENSEEKKNESNSNNNLENKSSVSKENNSINENNNEADNIHLNNNQETNNNLNNSNHSGGSQNNNNSSFLNSNHYNALHQNNEEELERINNTSPVINRENPFLTKGKFMQIQPHFGIFNRQVNDLQNGLYENTKKCLIYKSSLQQSENLIREQADNVTKELVDKIFNLRQLFFGANKAISMTINDVNNNMLKVKQSQIKLKKEIHECDRRINACESQVGYKLLGKVNYSFMKRYNSTLTQ